MKPIQKGFYGLPKAGETGVQVRFVNRDGQTEVWILPLDVVHLAELRGAVIFAGIDDQVDARISNQAASITRLTDHIAFHHNELKQHVAEQCTWFKSRDGKM